MVDGARLARGGGAEARAPEAELPVERGVGARLDDKDVLAVVIGGEVARKVRAVRGDERRGAAVRGVVGVRGRAAKDVERRGFCALGLHGPLHRAPLREEEGPPVPVPARQLQVPRHRRVCLLFHFPTTIHPSVKRQFTHTQMMKKKERKTNDGVRDEGGTLWEAVDDEGAGAVHAGGDHGVVGPRGGVERHEPLPAAVELRGAMGLRARRKVHPEQDRCGHDHACARGESG